MHIRLLIVIIALNTTVSQLLLKQAVSHIVRPTSLAAFPNFVAAAALSPWVYASLVLQVTGYILWMVVIANAKLGVSIALLGGGFYVLMAFCAWGLFGEELSPIQWTGIALITLGVGCLTINQV